MVFFGSLQSLSKTFSRYSVDLFELNQGCTELKTTRTLLGYFLIMLKALNFLNSTFIYCLQLAGGWAEELLLFTRTIYSSNSHHLLVIILFYNLARPWPPGAPPFVLSQVYFIWSTFLLFLFET